MPMPSYENILLETSGRVARLTVNRPAKLNALNSATLTEIGRAVQAVQADPEVGAIVVTGSGDKAFVAGADIGELSGLDAAGAKAFSEHGQRVFDTLENCRKPVIAAINGFTLGGGCELALACHIRIASSNARFGQPEVNLGLIPGAGGTQRLPRVVGRAHALYLIATGDQIKADEAHRIGLVSKVVEPAGLMDEAARIAGLILAKGPVAVGYALEAIRRGSEMSQDEAMAFEAALFGLCFATEDMKEGTRAFIEKRAAQFRGK
jgi:enoyl-CoA hydratase